MTDRELLELAAKAAGIPLKPDFAARYDYYMADPLMWNPLTDDGDALRLAVKLAIDVQLFALHSQIGDPLVRACVDRLGKCWPEQAVADPYAAARRAIVRAAAELGRQA